MPTTILELLKADDQNVCVTAYGGFTRRLWWEDGEFVVETRKTQSGVFNINLYRGTSEAVAVAALLGDPAPVSTPKIGA